jgi:hypothetical protein
MQSLIQVSLKPRLLYDDDNSGDDDDDYDEHEVNKWITARLMPRIKLIQPQRGGDLVKQLVNDSIEKGIPLLIHLNNSYNKPAVIHWISLRRQFKALSTDSGSLPSPLKSDSITTNNIDVDLFQDNFQLCDNLMTTYKHIDSLITVCRRATPLISSTQQQQQQQQQQTKYLYLRDLSMKSSDVYMNRLIKSHLKQQDLYRLADQSDKNLITSLYIGNGNTATNCHKDKAGTAAVSQLISCSKDYFKLWFVFDRSVFLNQYEDLFQTSTKNFVSFAFLLIDFGILNYLLTYLLTD